MRTLYIEDLASHDAPESCVVVREGGGEALAGVRAGSVLSREIKRSGVPTRLSDAEGNIAGGVMREPSADSARSKTRCMHGVSRRENREIPRSPASVDDAPSWMVRGVADQRLAGREGNAEAASPR